MTEPEYLTSTQAARILGISKKRLFDLLRSGKLPGTRAANGYRSWQIPLSAVTSRPPRPAPAPKLSGRTPSALDRAATRYEEVRWSDDRAQRDSAEAVLLAILNDRKVVHHHAGRAYWCHDGELHRAESRSFRSQTP